VCFRIHFIDFFLLYGLTAHSNYVVTK